MGQWNNSTKKITEIVKDKEKGYFENTIAGAEIRRRRQIEDFGSVR